LKTSHEGRREGSLDELVETPEYRYMGEGGLNLLKKTSYDI